MVSNVIVSFTIIVFATCAMFEFAFSQDENLSAPDDMYETSFSPSREDIQNCKDKAKEDGKKLKTVRKNTGYSCVIECVYENNEMDEVYADNGRIFSTGSLTPTGICKDGECKLFTQKKK